MIVCTVLAAGASIALAAAFPDACAAQPYGWAPATDPAVVCLSGPWILCVPQPPAERTLLA